jgi:hypothetical protein
MHYIAQVVGLVQTDSKERWIRTSVFGQIPEIKPP